MIITEDTTSLTFEAVNLSYAEPAAGKSPKKFNIQFWCCTTMIAYLLVQGWWLLSSASGLGANSLAGQIEVVLAVVLWSVSPSLVYFAWQAHRRQKQTEGRQQPSSSHSASALRG